MSNGLFLRRFREETSQKEGDYQSEATCLQQGGFQQIIDVSKCRIKPALAQRRRHLQIHLPTFPHFQPGMLTTSPEQFGAERPYFTNTGASKSKTSRMVKKEGFNVTLEDTQELDIYDPEKFVNREDELAMIKERVLAFRRREVVSQPLVNFWGMADIGKTWLLREIEHRFQYEPSQANELQKPTCALYFDFAEHEQTVTAVVHELIKSIAKNLAPPLLTNEREKELSKLIQSKNVKDSIKFIQSLSSDLVLIILLDTTEHVEDALWERLETTFLEPLLKSNKILLIVTGRNRVLRWKRVEVRRRATPIEKSQVQPFDQQATKKQLLSLGLSPDFAQELYEDSVGTPGLTTKLAALRLRLSQEDYYKEREKAWKQYIDDIFKHFSQLPDSFRQMITAVMPLRYYRTQALRVMLEGTTDYSDDTSDVFLLRTLRKLAKKTHLVWWDDQQNAYVTALAARQILNRRLQIEESAKFLELHGFALEMYREWARDYPASLPAYFPELLFHEATIIKAQNLMPDKSIKSANYMMMLDQMSIDNRDILHRRLKKDKELQSLIPKLYTKILTHLEKSVGSVEG